MVGSWRDYGRGFLDMVESLQSLSGTYEVHANGYLSRCHLSIFFPNGEGSSPSFTFVEERGPVHVVVADTIVTIGVHRARIATIVGVASQFDTTKAASGESTCIRIYSDADAKVRYNQNKTKGFSDKIGKLPKIPENPKFFDRYAVLFSPLRGGALRAGVLVFSHTCALRSLVFLFPCSLAYAASTGVVLNASVHSQRNADQHTPQSPTPTPP